MVLPQVSDSKAIFLQIIQEIEQASKAENGVTGLRSGFTRLDGLTKGFQNGQVTIVGSEEAMGKTAFLMAIARNIAFAERKVCAFISCEHNELSLMRRLISAEAEIHSEHISKGVLSLAEWTKIANLENSLPWGNLILKTPPFITLDDLLIHCWELRSKNNVDCIIIDSSSFSKNISNINYSAILKALKTLAVGLDIPIMLSYPLKNLTSRNPYVDLGLDDEFHKPKMEHFYSDLETVLIYADLVMLLYRPEYYGIITLDEFGMSRQKVAEVIVPINRNGSSDTIKLKYLGSMSKFMNHECD
ncbi:MAG: replicative DNA helicase [Cytophagales bacterium]